MPLNDHGLNPDSLERLVPDDLSENEATGADTLRLHIERYLFAKSNLTSGSVLDNAVRRYGNPRVSYTCCDAMRFSPGYQFGNIVSLETVEHVDDPKAFLAHLVSLLLPGGRLIASVPITPSVDANPHHKSNFSQNSFLLLGEAVGLRYLTSMSQVQHFNPVAIGMRSEARTAGLRRNLGSFYLKHPSHFALRVWSTLRDGFVNKYLTVVWQR